MKDIDSDYNLIFWSDQNGESFILEKLKKIKRLFTNTLNEIDVKLKYEQIIDIVEGTKEKIWLKTNRHSYP